MEKTNSRNPPNPPPAVSFFYNVGWTFLPFLLLLLSLIFNTNYNKKKREEEKIT
jgi:hypothetical protein